MIRRPNQSKFLTAALIFLLGGFTAIAQSSKSQPLRVFLHSSQILQQRKQLLSHPKSGNSSLQLALAKLEREADKALSIPVLSIVTKTITPPSGDKHDYMSQAPYWWPNPAKPNGLPYIRRDGERNPEITQLPDHALLDKMVDAVETLATAYYFTNREAYAEKAGSILRMWFLDPATRMNPNLEFAQAIPGINRGRGIGIIETRSLPRVIDAIGLLQGSRSWGQDDQAGLERWFAQYLGWLTESANGRDESDERNNHGTYYDVQVASLALFTGKLDLAKKVLESAKTERIAKQIEPDGRQPLELARTKSWSYSNMNLEGMIMLAELGENAGIDLWNFRTRDGRSLRGAIEFLYPYALDNRRWTYAQIEPIDRERFYSSMRRAAREFTDVAYRKAMLNVPNANPDDKNRLFGS